MPLVWIAGSVAAVVGLLVVLAALLLDPAVPAPEPPRLPPGLPPPGDVRTRRFPLVWRGYEPDAVDAHLAELTARYEALYAAADPTVRAAAEARLRGGGAGREPLPGDGDWPAASGEPRFGSQL